MLQTLVNFPSHLKKLRITHEKTSHPQNNFSGQKIIIIHGTSKAFAGGKGFLGLCRLPAAKQTGKRKWRNWPFIDHNLCNFDDNTVIKMIWGNFFSSNVHFHTHFNL